MLGAITLNQRDVIAVRRTVSGLLKLLHPNARLQQRRCRVCLTYAMEARRRVKEQLKSWADWNSSM